MIYDWFKIFNLTEFLALGLISKTYTLNLEGIGQKDILATSGKTTAITYEDVILSVNLNSKNPFEFGEYAVYLSESQDVYLGIAVDEN